MPICEPQIQVMCDTCDELSDGTGLTALAGGGWDERNVRRHFERQGWYFDNEGKAACPACLLLDREEEDE